MKVLIWFLFVFANSLTITLLKEAGILLGGIPAALLFGSTFWGARALCKKWDAHKLKKKALKLSQTNTKIKNKEKNKFRFFNKRYDSNFQANSTTLSINDEIEATTEDLIYNDVDYKKDIASKILASGIIEGQKSIELNKINQPNNEQDIDFGFVPEKPIYTVGINEQDRYLKSLRTINGDLIKYIRRGSISVEGVNGMIDIYDIFLTSGEKYKTIYFNMYGYKTSSKAPSGFVLENETIKSQNLHSKKKIKTKYCSRCGSLIDNETKICTGCGKKYFKGIRFNKFSITVIVLSLILVVSIIINIAQYDSICYLNRRESYLEKEINALEKEINVLEREIRTNKSILNLFGKYVVFVVNDGTKLYHKYDCSKLKGNTFWAYNIEAAQVLGYTACSKCH